MVPVLVRLNPSSAGHEAVDWDDVNALTNSLVYRIPVSDKAKEEIKNFVSKK